MNHKLIPDWKVRIEARRIAMQSMKRCSVISFTAVGEKKFTEASLRLNAILYDEHKDVIDIINELAATRVDFNNRKRFKEFIETCVPEYKILLAELALYVIDDIDQDYWFDLKLSKQEDYVTLIRKARR